jgi:hypothetical protein
MYKCKNILSDMSKMIVGKLSKASKIKRVLKWSFGSFSVFFIAMLFFIIVHDTMTGDYSATAEYCAKYGMLASPGCW